MVSRGLAPAVSPSWYAAAQQIRVWDRGGLMCDRGLLKLLSAVVVPLRFLGFFFRFDSTGLLGFFIVHSWVS